jgi:hypothetical protein
VINFEGGCTLIDRPGDMNIAVEGTWVTAVTFAAYARPLETHSSNPFRSAANAENPRRSTGLALHAGARIARSVPATVKNIVYNFAFTGL